MARRLTFTPSLPNKSHWINESEINNLTKQLHHHKTDDNLVYDFNIITSAQGINNEGKIRLSNEGRK